MSLELIKKQFQENKIGWEKSFASGLCQDELGNYLPWMCYPMIDYLKENLKKDEIIFEFGLGTSTLFFAQKVKKVFVIETRKKWFEIMKMKIIENKISNIEAILMENGLKNQDYENLPEIILNNNYENSVDEIFKIEDIKIEEKFDLIVVDSLKREKCVKNSCALIKNSGKILLDDSQRKNYQKIYDFMQEKGFKNLEFQGISPAQIQMKKGVLFFK